MEDLFSKLTLNGKNEIREQVWKLMEEKNCVRKYPISCHGKIPNFKGNQFAAKKVAKLREFKKAKVIKVNPSLAQMILREEIMKSGKILVVPSPALAEYGEISQENDVNFCYLLNGSELNQGFSYFLAKFLFEISKLNFP